MGKIWQHATPSHPCPICQGKDWCTFGDKAMLCQRVESDRPHSKGGWFHFYGGNKPIYIPKAKEAPQGINASEIMREYRYLITPAQLESYGEDIGVKVEALKVLGAGYSAKHRAWAFPMSDGSGNVIGIRLRNDTGFKWAVTGSRQGIFLPSHAPDSKVAYLPEGPTDTAALLSMGLYAIGRPSCMAGADLIRAAMLRLKIYKVVIVADNDELKKLGPSEGRPGIIGAVKLQKELGMASVIWVPPTKDVRDFYKAGGTRAVIEADIKNRVWTIR